MLNREIGISASKNLSSAFSLIQIFFRREGASSYKKYTNSAKGDFRDVLSWAEKE